MHGRRGARGKKGRGGNDEIIFSFQRIKKGCSFLELGTKHPWKELQRQIWSCDERMDHLVIAISGDPSRNQLPNADTIVHTSKILLKGPRYSCLL